LKQFLIILSLSVLIASGGCKDKMVCPAYQSTYILDDEKQSRKFSFFEEDSLLLEASNNTGKLKKNIYGLRERDYGYWSQERLLMVDQQDVYSDEIDSLLAKNAEPLEETAESGIYLDSSQMGKDTIEFNVRDADEDPWSNTKRFHYNVDFVNYMLLVGNDILESQEQARDSTIAKEEKIAVETTNAATDSTANEEKGFFKRLFKKKDKSDKKSWKEKRQERKERKRKEKEPAEEATKPPVIEEELDDGE